MRVIRPQVPIDIVFMDHLRRFLVLFDDVVVRLFLDNDIFRLDMVDDSIRYHNHRIAARERHGKCHRDHETQQLCDFHRYRLLSEFMFG